MIILFTDACKFKSPYFVEFIDLFVKYCIWLFLVIGVTLNTKRDPVYLFPNDDEEFYYSYR